MNLSDTQQQIVKICDQVKALLLDKNRRYGDSALNPTRIFSKASATEQLLVRIDDKLSRITKGVGLLSTDEDVLMDLMGYLVLLKIAIHQDNTSNWDGTDIESFGLRDSSTECLVDHVNDPTCIKMYTSGDRFA